ncbi:MAG: polysaccharide biosynthesis tyrosine autokinase, partial [Gemmatimonadota bacterium]|nr:polysaccharide biosynthesis tyrosine autokinase [Gemmatimonadota bacterium]
PREGAEIHNALVQSFIETASRLTQGRLREEVRILERQTEYAADQLRQAEMALQQFRVEAITEPGEPQAVQLPDGALAQDPLFGGFYQQQADLDQIEADLAELDAILDPEDGSELNVLRLRLVPSIQNYPAIGATISTLDQLRLEVRTLLYTYRPEHPDVVAKTDQIRDIREVQLPALIRELQTDLRNRRTVLQQQIDARAAELREIPTRSIEQGRLERRASLAEGLHNTLLSRLQTSRLAQQTALTNVRPLDAAFAPGGPEARTLPQFFVLLGSIAGLGLGIAGVLVRDRLDSRIRHPDDVSELGLPLLGVVPQLKSPDDNKAVAAVAVESFRSIRTQLSHAHGGQGGLVLITSSTPREGKSVVAANLAISYASAGLRTLLIDADVRRGRLHTVFNFPRSPGLTEHLAGDFPLEEVVRPQEDMPLDILCSGALSSDAELIGGERLDAFLAGVRRTYDAVVLDGPPLAAGADALILGQKADQVVMVFRAGATSEGMVRSRLGMLGNVEMPIVGAVLNAVPEHAPYYDQYVNYYYYAEAEVS